MFLAMFTVYLFVALQIMFGQTKFIKWQVGLCILWIPIIYNHHVGYHLGGLSF